MIDLICFFFPAGSLFNSPFLHPLHDASSYSYLSDQNQITVIVCVCVYIVQCVLLLLLLSEFLGIDGSPTRIIFWEQLTSCLPLSVFYDSIYFFLWLFDHFSLLGLFGPKLYCVWDRQTCVSDGTLKWLKFWR